MFKIGDTAYFNFIGKWDSGTYNGHYCLPPSYYPFMPIIILDHREFGQIYRGMSGMMCVVKLVDEGSWSLSVDCIEKDFSIEKFIIAQVRCKRKKATLTQFKYILSTLDRRNP